MKRAIIICAALGALAGLVFNLPLAWVAKPIVPKSITQTGDEQLGFIGTIWDGAVENIKGIGGVVIHTIPKNLFIGENPIQFTSLNPKIAISGQAGLHSITGVNIGGALSDMVFTDSRFHHLKGRYNVHLLEVKLGDGCQNADGTAETDVLAVNQAHWGWRGPVLSGPITCQDGAMLVALSGNDSAQSITADIQVLPDGTYRAAINLMSGQDELDLVLPNYGFEKNATGYRLTESGIWQ